MLHYYIRKRPFTNHCLRRRKIGGADGSMRDESAAAWSAALLRQVEKSPPAPTAYLVKFIIAITQLHLLHAQEAMLRGVP